MAINWNIASGPNAFDSALATGLKFGTMAREAAEKRELRSALATAASNPDDPQAIGAVFERNPELGMKLYDKADERAYRSALGTYMSQSGMLGGSLVATPEQRQQTEALEQRFPDAAMRQPSDSPPPPPIRSALGFMTTATAGQDAAPMPQPASPRMLSTPIERVPAPDPGAGTGAPTAAQPTAQPQAAPQYDIAALGQPKNGRDQAFLKMVQHDPIKALKIQSDLRDNFVKRIDAEHKFYSVAVEELGRMTDDAGWQKALGRLQPLAQAMGVNLGDTVPSTYPGQQATQQLMERALPIKDRLDYIMRETNMDADNKRADRNTDSMISTREGRLSQQDRYNSERIETTRRGQDLTDTRVRRGQDISASRPRSRGAGAASGRAKGTASSPVGVSTPAEAAALKPGTYYRTPDGRVKVR